MHKKHRHMSIPKAPIQIIDSHGRKINIDPQELGITSHSGHDPLTRRNAHSIQTFRLGDQIGIGTQHSLDSGFGIAATQAELNVLAINLLQSQGCRIIDRNGKTLSVG
jgi:hypothetical protein